MIQHYLGYAKQQQSGRLPNYLNHPIFRIVRAARLREQPYCQFCGEPASEVHHEDCDYPPWDTFDVPSNLTPICHNCHCKAHGKES
jgi:hypothetical protein